MTIAEAKRFYEQDSKVYELSNNREFLSWLKNMIKTGYHSYVSIDELQELINNIVNWYEIKYPERELEYYDGVIDTRFEDVKKISDVMNIRQLLYRLPHNQLSLMECGYRAKGWGHHPIYKDGSIIGWKSEIFMSIKEKNRDVPSFILSADYMTGEVNKGYELEDYLDDRDNVSLDDLLSIFNKYYDDELDFQELKDCVSNHNTDMELRYRVLRLVALKLLYSRNTTPERGYERAKRFIGEFNKKFDLNLSTKEIDEIISRDYTNGERLEFVTKTVNNADGSSYSYTTVEDVNKKDKPRGLIKKLFGRK